MYVFGLSVLGLKYLRKQMKLRLFKVAGKEVFPASLRDHIFVMIFGRRGPKQPSFLRYIWARSDRLNSPKSS